MDDAYGHLADETDDGSAPVTPAGDEEDMTPEAERALVAKTLKTIKADKRHHEKASERMTRDMYTAAHGADKEWIEGKNYVANIAGRHVKQKTASLYAKNPKIVARRRETLDYQIWDGNPQSLMMAVQLTQQAAMMQQAAATMPPQIDPMTGQPAAPQLPPGFGEAQALIADFQEGTARKEQMQKIGKTLEILFAYAMREQKPLDFKTGLKRVVRRACTTGVGYVELNFQRAYGPRPGLAEELADARSRLDHIQALMKDVAEGEIEEDDPEIYELQTAIETLQAEPEILLREGLLFDYPTSLQVVPSRHCKSLVGFVGAPNLSVQYLYTPDKVKEVFGVDLKGCYAGYNADWSPLSAGPSEANKVADDSEGEETSKYDNRGGLVCVYKYYDKDAGTMSFVAEGYKNFLRKPGPPDVFVEDFWPVYAITFNDVENDSELFPPSDVSLMMPMQQEYNRSRQGMREHRQAARPRWGYANGIFDDDDIDAFKSARPFDAFALNIDPQTKLADALQAIPVPGVDPNLYETQPIFADTELVVGSSQAQFGGVSKATATESAIAANSTQSADQASVDDLDNFLTTVARAGGQILLKEMSPEKVTEIVGPGAVWPHLSLAEIADELFLEIEAGSTGKPNQAIEINNWSTMLPLLLQIPGIDPNWLAKQALQRLDDRLDLTDAFVQNIPAIVAQNRMAQPMPADPGADPNQQGGEGGDKNAAPADQRGGSGPAFGSNQVQNPV
jgi:hypothetical protein